MLELCFTVFFCFISIKLNERRKAHFPSLQFYFFICCGGRFRSRPCAFLKRKNTSVLALQGVDGSLSKPKDNLHLSQWGMTSHLLGQLLIKNKVKINGVVSPLFFFYPHLF